MFSKGDNFRDFLFAHLEYEIFSKWGPLWEERICSGGSELFPLWDDPNLYGKQQWNDIVASPENIPTHLKKPWFSKTTPFLETVKILETNLNWYGHKSRITSNEKVTKLVC